MGQAQFRIEYVDDEYQVVVTVGGKRVEARTYYTDDPDDARETLAAMKEEEAGKERG